MKLRAGIIGGAGYTGGELIRLLIRHPHAAVSFIHSRSNAGKAIHSVHQDLLGDTNLEFTDQLSDDIDVLFLCLGHGESKKFLSENAIAERVKIIDLANDFRLIKDSRFQSEVRSQQSEVRSQKSAPDSYQDGSQLPIAIGTAVNRDFVYGLPELNREKIRTANNIANPGCFATSIQLGLLPLAKAGLLKEIYTTGITGSTGAGQSLTQTSHFSWRNNNIQAYKTLNHQHLGEIGESLLQLQPKKNIELSFVPWRGDFTRGIFISSTITCELPLEEINELYISYYKEHRFTHVSKDPIFMKQVVNTNKALIQLEKTGNKLVIHSTIDNLLKGASGQAVQNMNLVFGIEETSGLLLKANHF